MRKKNILVDGMVLLIVFCLASCQPSPEDAVVVGKDAEHVESVVQAQESETSVESFPEHYQDSYQGGDDNVLVNIDAEVKRLPEKVSILRVTPHEITSEEVQRWADALFEGNLAYEPARELSKKDLSQKILEIRRILGDEELLWSNAVTQEDYESIKNYWEEQLSFYEEKYEAAPDIAERKETDWTFRSGEYYDYLSEMSEGDAEYENEIRKRQELTVNADVAGNTVKLSAVNRSEEDYHIHNLHYIVPDEAYEQNQLSMTSEEAVAVADLVVKKAGLDDWDLSSCTEAYRGGNNGETYMYYALRYTRKYNGVPMTPLPQLTAIGTDAQYAAACYYETLEMHVSNGRVCYVSWMQPMDIAAVENENTQILDFDKIMSCCKNMMQATYTSDHFAGFSMGNDQNAKFQIDIDRIQSGLMRIQVPNKEYEFYLIPVWSFYGTANGQEQEHEMGSASVDSPLLMLNAVDGSHIDINLGY